MINNNDLTTRHLPHLYLPYGTYFITFRIKDTLPIEVLNKFKSDTPKRINSFINYDLYLGKLVNKNITLLRPDIKAICKEAIEYYDSKKYILISYCIMSNHIHILFTLKDEYPNIGEILKVIKGYSGFRINKLVGSTGAFWQSESYDRLIRNEAELYFTIKYILLNPVCAGLVDDWKKWDVSYCHPEYEININSSLVSEIIKAEYDF